MGLSNLAGVDAPLLIIPFVNVDKDSCDFDEGTLPVCEGRRRAKGIFSSSSCSSTDNACLNKTKDTKLDDFPALDDNKLPGQKLLLLGVCTAFCN